MKLAFAAVSIVVLAAAGGALAWSHSAPSKPAHRSRVAATAEPSSADDEGANDGPPLRPSPRFTLAPAALPAPQHSAVAPGAPGSGPPPPTIFNEVPAAEIPQHVQTLFEAEPATAWARGARASLTDKLDQVRAADARVESVDCRASTCKVTTVFPDTAAQRAYFDKAYLGGGAAIASLNMAMYAHLSETPDGVKSEVYLYNGGFP